MQVLRHQRHGPEGQRAFLRHTVPVPPRHTRQRQDRPGGSALIKRYVAKAGSDWIEATALKAGNVLAIPSRVTMVEVWSALARRQREASISAQHHADALAAFRKDCQTCEQFHSRQSTAAKRRSP